MNASVSVIIPNLHSALIGDVIDAIMRQRAHLAEVIVVGQDRYELVRPPARFIETPRPVSAARARNLGARAARGAWLLFIDSDCIAAPDLIERMVERLSNGIQVLSGGIAVESGDYWTVCDNLLTFHQYLATAPPGVRDYLPSLNLGIRRELFLAVGGFDEGYPGAAGEDTDLSLRLRAAGLALHFEPRAVVAHRPPRTTPRAVWEHLRAFGRVQVRLWRLYPRLMPPPAPLRLMCAVAPLLRIVAPALALRDARMLDARARLWPGLAWARCAWYWGVAEGMAAHQ